MPACQTTVADGPGRVETGRQNSVRYDGARPRRHLFEHHINEIVNKSDSFLVLIYSNFKYMSSDTFVMLYKTTRSTWNMHMIS